MKRLVMTVAASALIVVGTAAGASAEDVPPTRTPVTGYKPYVGTPAPAPVSVCIYTKTKRHGKVIVHWKCSAVFAAR